MHVRSFLLMWTLSWHRPGGSDAVRNDDVLKTVRNADIHVCYYSRQPLRLPDPFPAEQKEHDNFGVMVWTHAKLLDGDSLRFEDPKRLMYVGKGETPIFVDTRFHLFQNWGIQLRKPQKADSGRYTASLSTGATVREVITDVRVLRGPIITSDRLRVHKKINPDTGEITFSCGTIGDLGSPAFKFSWKLPNGASVSSRFKSSSIWQTFKKGADITGAVAIKHQNGSTIGFKPGKKTLYCIVETNELALSCISSKNWLRWQPLSTYTTPKNRSTSNRSNFSTYVLIALSVLAMSVAATTFLKSETGKKFEFFNANSVETDTSPSSSEEA